MNFVRFVGTTTCSGAEYRAALLSGEHVVLDPASRRSNISVRFTLDGTPVHLPLRPEARDFLDLACCVYVGDELASREQAPDHWTRTVKYLVPVREPNRWAAVHDLLVSTLRTLSGDSIAFRWVERTGIIARTQHRQRLSRRFDTVCLFSGGIDSFLGAHHLLKEGRKVLLVGHQADGTTASVQTRLAEFLRARFGRSVALLQCRVAQSLGTAPRFALPQKTENSHRPRSFLFLALGVTAASVLGIDQVVIPENGLIALNVPLQRSRFGTLSTRTAHPRFLYEFRRLVHALGIFEGVIQNPFIAQSKTDMMRSLDPELRATIGHTVSCAKTGRVRWAGMPGVRHCGFCVPCIYRRVAMAHADLDRSADYEEDAFHSGHAMSAARQTDLRALVQFARQTVGMTGARRQLRITSHGVFPPEAVTEIGGSEHGGYAELADLTLRWSQEFLALLGTASSPGTRRLLSISRSLGR